ncbi:2-oxoacid:acceptor oxidoreductase family protein [Nitrosomonas sp.]|uniref:2-oxoacid:acceptor oxidoreductase family protein n=1 Tax=Nitrosomonas sp. TaxID=42353 RepID=UPI001D55FB6C|nr:2-oxoacid:acceptor oxidoreductase family protein [Nitrosomonas sp.]MBX3617743.1 2-oxoacid:acceptor oxidoreductase family protein [Nitrosomonas sp.]
MNLTTMDSLELINRINAVTNLSSSNLNIMIVGLGGLGVVSFTHKVRDLLALRYSHIHTTEQRGVAQKRASTSAVITASDFFIAPSLSEAKVNLLIALEPLEALRSAHLLEPDGVCFIADTRIETICGCHRKYVYPSTKEIVQLIELGGVRCLTLPVTSLLRSERLLPVHTSSAMLGMFCAAFNFDLELVLNNSDKNKVHSLNTKNRTALQWGCNQFQRIQSSNESISLTDPQPMKSNFYHQSVFGIKSVV